MELCDVLLVGPASDLPCPAPGAAFVGVGAPCGFVPHNEGLTFTELLAESISEQLAEFNILLVVNISALTADLPPFVA